jgi:hypothetical protein
MSNFSQIMKKSNNNNNNNNNNYYYYYYYYYIRYIIQYYILYIYASNGEALEDKSSTYVKGYLILRVLKRIVTI